MKILLATDGSDHSESAAKFLARIPWTSDDGITVFHAIYAVPFRTDERFYYENLKAIKKDLAPRILDSTAALLKAVPARVSVEIEEFSPDHATPAQCIINVADLSGADLIVLGGRGIRGFASAFLGSVTREVTIRSFLPVLVVHPKRNTHDHHPLRILFAADGSPDAQAAGDFLTRLPLPEDTEVTVLNVVSSGFSDIPERFVLEVDDRIKEIVAGARESEFTHSERIVEEAGKRLGEKFRRVQTLSRAGNPSMEILKTGEDVDADLIVLGGGGLQGIKGILGSVSRNILSHTDRSLIIGKRSKAAGA